MDASAPAADPWGAVTAALAGPGAATSDYDLVPGARAALPPARRLKPAAVLLPLVERDGRLGVVLTRRSRALRRHPGQIAFPGGRVDADDATPWDAALREAEEEIGLNPALVSALGRLPAHETVTGFLVEPHVGRVAPGHTVRAAESEVAEVFEVPLDFLTEVDHYRAHDRLWHGRRRAYWAVPWGAYYIWGATACILKALADRVQGAP